MTTRDEDIAAVVVAAEAWRRGRSGMQMNDGRTDARHREERRVMDAAITHALDREQKRTLEATVSGGRCFCREMYDESSGKTAKNGKIARCPSHVLLSEVRERREEQYMEALETDLYHNG